MTVKEVREYALEHYNEGGCTIIECYTDKDIEEFILSKKNPMKIIKDIMSMTAEKIADAEHYEREGGGDW